jgi:hypothetical protein
MASENRNWAIAEFNEQESQAKQTGLGRCRLLADNRIASAFCGTAAIAAT